VLLVYGLVLLGLLIIDSLIFAQHLAAYSPTSGPGFSRNWAEFGRQLWQWALVLQLVIVILISPGLTATAISGEREHGTLDLLLLTPMGILPLVVGKFLGAIGQMLLVVLSGLPVISAVFIYGGVSPQEVIWGYALIMATGMLYAAVGFLASSFSRRTIPAIAWAYGSTLAILVGIPLLYVLLLMVDQAPAPDTLSAFVGNPFLLLIADGESLLRYAFTVLAFLLETFALITLSLIIIRRRQDCLPLFSRRISLESARRLSRRPDKTLPY